MARNTPTFQRNSYCSFCGQPFDTERPWPRACAHCQNTTYLNPTPVAVILQPVGKQLLVVRRRIEPGRGKLALPGGFIELGESWKTATARELREETRLTIDPEPIRIFDVYSAVEAGVILIFGLAPPLDPDSLQPFEPTAEVSELCLISEPTPMAFPLHEKAVSKYFDSLTNER